jgi:thiopeptide-type bacteriocin biosynthesis protein
VISIGEHTAASDALGVADLAVTADATRLRLVARATGRPVEPTMLNAVELAAFTHPLARLLCELPRARAAGVGPFDWGAAARLPFLPRVRHGRSVLAPATWRIRPSDLPSPDASAARWRHSVTAWRQRMRVPATVEVGDSDRALRLDLDRGADTALLRAELQQAGQVTLREAPEPGAYGWFDARPHEITLAMAATNIPLRPAQPIPTTPPVVVDRNHGQLPGASSRAYLKLYGHPDRVPDILTSHLPRLQASLDATSEASRDAGVDQPLEWWFLRYQDPAEHLRLRFRLPNSEAFGALAAQVGAWAADLRQQGLLSRAQWDTYYPETGRYGTGPAMAAAETVFAADSAAVLAQIALTSHASPYPQAVLAASLVDLATSTIGDIASGMRWLLKHPPAEPAEHPDRALHQTAISLATPHDGFAALSDQPGGAQVLAAWQARRKSLNEYRTQLTAGGQPRPADVLASLIHLHHLRMIGVDPASERLCYRLARSAALTWAARVEGGRR